MKRLVFGKIDTNIKPSTIYDPVKIYSMLMCMLFQEIINIENKKNIPIYSIFKMPIHDRNNGNLTALVWNSSNGTYEPHFGQIIQRDSITLKELKDMI